MKRTTRQSAFAAVASSVLILVGGCGSSDGGDVTSTPAAAPSATSLPAASASGSAAVAVSTTPAESSPAAAAGADADPRDFESAGGYYFQSPSGSIKCAVYTNNDGTGCQLSGPDAVAPPSMEECWSRPNMVGGAKSTPAESEYLCTNQGIYVGPPINQTGTGEGGGRVLQYGEVLTVAGSSCTSETTGITCRTGGRGFHVSKEQTTLF